MNHGSLFSGIGGFDLAAEWMGWNNVFHCEINPFGQKVLKYYWPNSISYDDITKTNFTVHRGRIDILTGGFPCQPFSLAGKRKGTADHRHLWPEMLRAIREIQPTWVVGENVFGIVNWNGGLVFEQVQDDLEAEGYEVQPFILPACSVNAPHRRDRVWFVANTNSNGHELRGFRENRQTQGKSTKEQEKRKRVRDDSWGISKQGVTSDTNSNGYDAEPASANNRIRENNQQQRTQRFSTIEGFSNERTTPDTEATRYKRTDTERTAPDERRAMQQPGFDGFPTQSPVRCGNDGLSSELAGITVSNHRNESIKAYGNAIVPQVVLQIFKAIEKMTKK